MTTDLMLMTTDLEPQEQAVFNTEFTSVRKDKTVGFLLTLFLGGLGAHRYYLGETGLGIVYTLFFWTAIPALVAFIELFLIGRRIDRYNSEKAQAIVSKIKLMRNNSR